MPSPLDWLPANGASFTWLGNEYKCMKCDREDSAPSRGRSNMTTLDVPPGEEEVMVLDPMKPKRDPAKITITYKALTDTVAIEAGVEGTLETEDAEGTFRCTAATKPRESGKWIEGTATFEELIDDEIVDFGS